MYEHFYIDLALLLRMVTPCNIINNELAKKYFGSIEANSFRDLYFLKYLNTPRFSESKRLAYELLTIYLTENPLMIADSLFSTPELNEKYKKWLLMNQPEVHSRLESYKQSS